MNARLKNIPSQEGQQMLESLRQAVGKALDTKRRLGQYAVIWKDGKPVFVGEESLKTKETKTDP